MEIPFPVGLRWSRAQHFGSERAPAEGPDPAFKVVRDLRPGAKLLDEDISKIQRMLGWAPTVSFEDGVATMLRHIEHWADAPVWDPASIAEATKTWFQFLTRSS